MSSCELNNQTTKVFINPYVCHLTFGPDLAGLGLVLLKISLLVTQLLLQVFIL